MKVKTKFKVAVGVVTLLLGTLSVQAQTMKEAMEAYNAAAKLDNAKNYQEALKKYEEAISIYDDLGDPTNQYRMKSADRIPVLQYKYGLSLYKQKKFDETITAFNKLEDLAKKYNNDEYAKKAKGIIPKLYYAKGKNLMDNGNDEGALEAFNKAVPAYGMAYIRMAQIYSQQNDEENFSNVIENTMQLNNSKLSATAEKLALAFYGKNAAKAAQASEYPKAEKYFNELAKYQEDSDVYYQLAVVYNKQQKWDEAINASNKALELFTEEGTTKDAKLYFELGSAYKGKGEKAAACDAFKKAAKGDYEEAANYEIEHTLKCQ
jgi:tetratricopeptide (TPR) repeat protein